MITGPQLRAARGLLDWTRTEVAKAAKVSPETVKNIEHGTFRPQEETAERIKKAFAQYDVIFTENEGVMIKKDGIATLEGFDGLKTFMDDVYETCKQSYSLDGTKPVCVSNCDNNLFKKHLRDYGAPHINRMMKIEKLAIRTLATKKDETIVAGANDGAKYLVYKYTRENNKSLPFYVYGDKFAIVNFDVENAPRIIVISSALVAQSFRDQFEIMWKTAFDKPER